MVEEMDCRHILGATNLPFASAAAQRLAERERGIQFVPEGITSAGAVIVDSVEQFDPSMFVEAHPDELYDFCRENVFQKTNQINAVPGVDAAAKMPGFLEHT